MTHSRAALDESSIGLTWVIDDAIARASHALVDQGRVWFIDPTDEPAALERSLALGRPVAVVQLLDRHNRDCAMLAERLGIPHLKVPAALPDTPFEVIPLVNTCFWREVALWWAEARVMVVAEAIGTHPAMYAPDSMGAGVHIGRRLWPPRRLAAYEPEHLLVGHGAALHGSGASAALHEAISRSRRDLPRAILALPRVLAHTRR